jgi:hypothetical protein
MRKHHEQKNLTKNRLHKIPFLLRGLYKVLFFGAIVFLSVAGLRVAAQSTTINATLCDHQGPEIIFVTPVDKSTVNQGSVLLHAATLRTTQVDIYVNAVYSHTTALAYGEDLETEIALNEGENKIELRAHFSCNQTSGIFDFTLYYDRNAEPGSDLMSTAEPRLAVASIIPGGPPTNIEVLDHIVNRLTGAYVLKPDYVRFVFSWLSFFVSVFGLYIVLYPKRIGDKVIGRIKNKRLHHRIDLMVRWIGLLVIVSAVLILMV